MRRVIYSLSPIGLGHSTRALAIAEELKKFGIEVEFATGGRACTFLKQHGYKVHDIISEPNPIEFGGKVYFPLLWYIRYWLSYNKNKKRVSELLDKSEYSLIIGDEEFSSLITAINQGRKCVMITDETNLNFAQSWFSRYVESKVIAWYKELQSRVDLLIIPEFGADHANIRYVGPIVRQLNKTRKEIFQRYNLPHDKKMILCSFSGSGLGEYIIRSAINFCQKAKIDNSFIVVTGKKVELDNSEGIFNLGLIDDNHELVAYADLVITTAGKSTIDEAASYGTPIIAIPLKNHFEQEDNALELGYSFNDVARLDELVHKQFGERREPKNYEGAKIAASCLAKLIDENIIKNR
ncbi:MAG: glycosyltransferase [Conexivisphaerales archaeon]